MQQNKLKLMVCMQYLLALQLLPLLPGFQQVQSGLGCQGVLGDQQVLRLPVYIIIMMMTIVVENVYYNNLVLAEDINIGTKCAA